MVARRADFFFSSPPCNSILENPATPAGRDNTSILPLEWLSGKLKNLAALHSYACLECHQPLF